MAENSDSSEYQAVVSSLIQKTADELRVAGGDPLKQRQALCRYYKRGREQGLSTGELVDFLGVSDGCILEAADLDDDEFDAIMEMSADLTDEEIDAAN